MRRRPCRPARGRRPSGGGEPGPDIACAPQGGAIERRWAPLSVHLIDGTYELFRQFYGRLRFEKESRLPLGAVAGVLHSILEMIEKGATHVGVATDHVIESFRNELWPGYKTGAGIDRALWAQFHPLEDALHAMGIAAWPMIELEADDALASAAHLAAGDDKVHQVCIWTPDKDLAQCVRGDRVVQVLRKARTILDAAGVRKKFGVGPERIPDLLALVGDAADGYPGIAGIGRVGAARLIEQYGALEDFPPAALGEDRTLALLFKDLATLRTDARLFANVEELRWRGPTGEFSAMAAKIGDARLLARAIAAEGLAA
jgi:5'-3' exonuclease